MKPVNSPFLYGTYSCLVPVGEIEVFQTVEGGGHGNLLYRARRLLGKSY